MSKKSEFIFAGSHMSSCREKAWGKAKFKKRGIQNKKASCTFIKKRKVELNSYVTCAENSVLEVHGKCMPPLEGGDVTFNMIHSRGKMMLLECTKFRAFNNFLKLF
jgi:hypothetical protein